MKYQAVLDIKHLQMCDHLREHVEVVVNLSAFKSRQFEEVESSLRQAIILNSEFLSIELQEGIRASKLRFFAIRVEKTERKTTKALDRQNMRGLTYSLLWVTEASRIYGLTPLKPHLAELSES